MIRLFCMLALAVILEQMLIAQDKAQAVVDAAPKTILPAAPLPAVGVQLGPAQWTGVIGLAHGKKGFSPIGSLDYRLSEHYGLYFSRSTVAYTGGISFSFGHAR
jgi:hypothetical protein